MSANPPVVQLWPPLAARPGDPPGPLRDGLVEVLRDVAVEAISAGHTLDSATKLWQEQMALALDGWGGDAFLDAVEAGMAFLAGPRRGRDHGESADSVTRALVSVGLQGHEPILEGGKQKRLAYSVIVAGLQAGTLRVTTEIGQPVSFVGIARLDPDIVGRHAFLLDERENPTATAHTAAELEAARARIAAQIPRAHRQEAA